MNTAAVITTKNEVDSIGAIVAVLKGFDWRVYVVDEGSTDGTAPVAQMAGAIVIPNRGKRGIGPALMTGWRVAWESGADEIVQLDAGHSHDPWQAPQVLAGLAEADVVIGSRFLPKSRYHGRPWRARASRFAALAMNLTHFSHYSDWTSGYRAFSRTAIADLLKFRYIGRMHGWQIEVLARASGLGLTIAEVPIVYHAGESAFTWKTAMEALDVWLHVLHHVPTRRQAKALVRL